MGKHALMFAAALMLLRAPVPLRAQTPEKTSSTSVFDFAPISVNSAESVNRIAGYTAWDDDYLYIALQVNKPGINANNSQPFSNPLADDAALVFLQTDNDHKSMQRTAKTVVAAVSAAGGAQLYLGADKHPLFGSFREIQQRLEDLAKTETDPAALTLRRTALLGSIPRFAVTQKGAPLPGGANARGYTLEIAIPWTDLGGKPDPGAKMGFQVAVQSTIPGSPLLQSLSARVKGASDLDNPSLWGEILFSNAPGAPAGGAVLSPRVLAAKPVMDGVLTPGEWNALTGFEFGERIGSRGGATLLTNTLAARVRPDYAPRPARPVVPIASVAPPATLAAHHPQTIAPQIFARYVYSYQADPRKSAPVQQTIRPDGSTALIHHPLDGVGPWFSYDRAGWHRRQLQDIRRAGIDVILPVYRGAPRDRQLYADKGLLALASALNSMRLAGEDYPQVGLMLDTDALIEILGDRPDLRDATAQNTLYDLVRDFYQRIPAPFRYAVPLSGENGGRMAYPVFLSNATAFANIDASFIATLRSRFAADFNGADLVVLGDAGFQGKAPLDGYFGDARENGFQYNGGGWIKTASISPGYDTTLTVASSETKPTVRPRRDGIAYHDAWSAALAKRPDWILLDSWNDFANGTDLAPTLETGYSYPDVTRVYARQFAGASRVGFKFLWNDVPSAMLTRQPYAIHARVQNTGLDSWGETAGPEQSPVAFSYRWKRGGQIVGSGTLTSLPSLVGSGKEVSLTLPIAAMGAGNSPLPAGDYVLEIGAVEISRRNSPVWAGDTAGSTTLQVPVVLREKAGPDIPAWAATLVSSDLPATLESGSVYDVQATLRNDGASVWRKSDGARVTLRLYRQAPKEGAAGSLTETPVAAADATAELAQDVAPGQETTVHLTLPLLNADGQPLPVWNQEDTWTYVARWEVAADRGQTASAASGTVPASLQPHASAANAMGVSIAPQPLGIVDFDFGPRFTVDGTPGVLPGDRRQPVRLSLKNAGPQIWKKEGVRVGYHWYYLDGSEYVWEDETTAIGQDVPPGGTIKDMLAWVTAPPCDGTYWLVWDLKVGDTWASTSASARVFDQVVTKVEVVRGRLNFADLSHAYNVSGTTDDENMAGGDFDGQGDTFPAALLPPFVNTVAVPSGMWLPAGRTGPDSPRRISFKWGPKGSKEKNFIACLGQKVLLGKGGEGCRMLHIIAASTGKEGLNEMKLIFQEPTSQSEDIYAFQVSRWDRPPTHDEDIAFLSRRHHARNGVQPGAVALYHYMIPIHQPRKLVAIQLPNAPEIKIAAITMEK